MNYTTVSVLVACVSCICCVWADATAIVKTNPGVLLRSLRLARHNCSLPVEFRLDHRHMFSFSQSHERTPSVKSTTTPSLCAAEPRPFQNSHCGDSGGWFRFILLAMLLFIWAQADCPLHLNYLSIFSVFIYLSCYPWFDFYSTLQLSTW